jgi:hypothetical protein
MHLPTDAGRAVDIAWRKLESEDSVQSLRLLGQDMVSRYATR